MVYTGIAFLTLIIIIVLYYKTIYKESFSASKTNIIYSNYENDSNLDKYAKINEEILILEQEPGKDRVLKFKYLRAPLNKYIVVYVRKEQESGQITINSKLIKIESVNTNLIDTLGKNGIFISDASNVIRYYIKFLDDQTYAIEKGKDDKKNEMLARFRQCVDLKKTTSNYAVALSECKQSFNM